MAKLETMFCVATWSLMNLLLLTMTYETTFGAAELGKAEVVSAVPAPAA